MTDLERFIIPVWGSFCGKNKALVQDILEAVIPVLKDKTPGFRFYTYDEELNRRLRSLAGGEISDDKKSLKTRYLIDFGQSINSLVETISRSNRTILFLSKEYLAPDNEYCNKELMFTLAKSGQSKPLIIQLDPDAALLDDFEKFGKQLADMYQHCVMENTVPHDFEIDSYPEDFFSQKFKELKKQLFLRFNGNNKADFINEAVEAISSYCINLSEGGPNNILQEHIQLIRAWQNTPLGRYTDGVLKENGEQDCVEFFNVNYPSKIKQIITGLGNAVIDAIDRNSHNKNVTDFKNGLDIIASLLLRLVVDTAWYKEAILSRTKHKVSQQHHIPPSSLERNVKLLAATCFSAEQQMPLNMAWNKNSPIESLTVKNIFSLPNEPPELAPEKMAENLIDELSEYFSVNLNKSAMEESISYLVSTINESVDRLPESEQSGFAIEVEHLVHKRHREATIKAIAEVRKILNSGHNNEPLNIPVLIKTNFESDSWYVNKSLMTMAIVKVQKMYKSFYDK